MKNVIIWATIRTGRTYTAKKIREAIGDRVGAIAVVDEIYATAKPNFGDAIVVGMGFTSTGEALLKLMQEKKDDKALLGLEWAKKVCADNVELKKNCAKWGIKYFDTTGKEADVFIPQIVEFVKKSI